MKIIREDHPFDRGYWLRYDGMPRPAEFRFEAGRTVPVDPMEHQGWDECDGDIRFDTAPGQQARTRRQLERIGEPLSNETLYPTGESDPGVTLDWPAAHQAPDDTSRALSLNRVGEDR